MPHVSFVVGAAFRLRRERTDAVSVRLLLLVLVTVAVPRSGLVAAEPEDEVACEWSPKPDDTS